jgi:hypothetical protein
MDANKQQKAPPLSPLSLRERLALHYLMEPFAGKRPFVSVTEPSGSRGAVRDLLRDMGLIDKDTFHLVWLNSTESVLGLQKKFPWATVIYVADPWRCDFPFRAEFVSLALDGWTPTNAEQHPSYRGLTRKTFKSAAKYILLRDSAPGQLRYAAVSLESHAAALGVSSMSISTTLGYVRLVGETIGDQFGYRFLRGSYHSDTAYYLFQRGRVQTSVPTEIVQVVTSRRPK